MSLKAPDLVHKSTFEEIYVFLPDFQVIIQLDDLAPDFLSSVIIVFWTVWDYHSIYYSVLRLIPRNDVSCLHSGCQVDLPPGNEMKGIVPPFGSSGRLSILS